MNEPYVLQLIRQGSVDIKDVSYRIIPNPSGSCHGCSFNHEDCNNSVAQHICCSAGGQILIKEIKQ